MDHWNPYTSSFHFPYGMMKITLLDVVGLIGLKPTDNLLAPEFQSTHEVIPNMSSTKYWKFIENNMKSTVIIYDEEHIAFLLLWLHHSFLCDKSCRISASYIPLANFWHEGKDVCLSKILLSSLYESLGMTYKSLKGSNSIPSNMARPLWLFQLWLNVIYTPCFAASSRTTGSRAPYGVCLVPITLYIRKEDYVTSLVPSLIYSIY